MQDQPITVGYFCFSPGETFTQLLCLSRFFFFLTFIWWLHGIDFYPPVCCLCEQHTSRGEGNGERWKAHFFLQGGFHTPPLKEAFRAHPLRFLDENRGNMWARMHQARSGWVSWRMLRRRVAFNPKNQFTSRRTHRTK